MSGRRRVTHKDVAALAGVSGMTVSRVINGARNVAPETRERVQAAMQELGYVPNAFARGLASQRSHAIGVVVPDMANPFFTLIIRGAESVARRSGYRVIVCNTEGDLALERDAFEEMLAHHVDGLLVAPVSDQSRSPLRQMIRQGLPVVLVDRFVSDLRCDVVRGDSYLGARMLVRHLVEVGHRKIGLIAGPSNVSTARDRTLGFRETLAAAGLSVEESWIVETDRVDPHGGRIAMEQLLARATVPTAVLVWNNFLAAGALQAIRASGRRVPVDVAVVCFDDNDYAAMVYPFLTVVATPAESFGTIGTHLLLERIVGREPERPRLVVLPPELIVRVSCGATRRNRREDRLVSPDGRVADDQDDVPSAPATSSGSAGSRIPGRTAPLRKMKSP
jgi:LacI family transcriptional regulator